MTTVTFPNTLDCVSFNSLILVNAHLSLFIYPIQIFVSNHMIMTVVMLFISLRNDGNWGKEKTCGEVVRILRNVFREDMYIVLCH